MLKFETRRSTRTFFIRTLKKSKSLEKSLENRNICIQVKTHNNSITAVHIIHVMTKILKTLQFIYNLEDLLTLKCFILKKSEGSGYNSNMCNIMS